MNETTSTARYPDRSDPMTELNDFLAATGENDPPFHPGYASEDIARLHAADLADPTDRDENCDWWVVELRDGRFRLTRAEVEECGDGPMVTGTSWEAPTAREAARLAPTWDPCDGRAIRAQLLAQLGAA